MRELYEGNLAGGLLYWETLRKCQVRLWKLAFVSIGPSFGEHEDAPFLGPSREG